MRFLQNHIFSLDGIIFFGVAHLQAPPQSARIVLASDAAIRPRDSIAKRYPA